MPITINILFGFYALFKLPVRLLIVCARGLKWLGKNSAYMLMLFIRHGLPFILLVAAWFGMLLGFWWLVLPDRQLAEGAQWFAATMSMFVSAILFVPLHDLGRDWRKGKVHW